MDQLQDQQQQQQQHGTQGNPGPPPIAPNPNGMTAVVNAQQSMTNQAQGMTSHLMGLMANPALAAAAAASPLFPPTAMLTNPGAFFAMPDMFGANGAVNAQNAHAIQAATASYAMQQAAPSNNNGSMSVYPETMGNQQPQHLQQVQISQQQQQSQQLPVQMGQPATRQIPPESSASAAIQAQMAAAAAAAAAAESVDTSIGKDKNGKRKKDLSEGEKAKQNRDRNREHARSTRLRKKAYIQKLKELVEGLHAERTEEVRQRRVAIQHLAEMQNVRRAVIRSFLRFHSNYEKDKRKWSTLLEDECWLKQPVTPYRCFRRSEIEQECRISRGLDSILADAASIAVMIEGVGSRSTRWMQIKREDFFLSEEERTGRKHMPRNIDGQNSRFQHAVSSLSASSSNSSNNGSGGEDGRKKKQRSQNGNVRTQNISNSSASSNASHREQNAAAQFHDYHANPLPDPKLDSERSNTSISEDSPEESNTSSADDTKRVSTDSSSGDDSAAAIKDRPLKRRKHESNNKNGDTPDATDAKMTTGRGYLPQNIAKRGGITHNVRPVTAARIAPNNGNERLSMAPVIPLPPFAGIGKKSQVSLVPSTGTSASSLPDGQPNGSEETPADQNRASRQSDLANVVGPTVIISGDVETSSSNSSRNRPQIRAYYHVNEDDMIIMDDIIMCPFVFRTQDAVLCGALAECVMPGMLRGHFSSRNKLISLEMTYDAMGFMQQLERASGSEMTARIVPGSLEMALSPTTTEARVITLAKPPFQIVNVNETWTKLVKYTQMEVEGLELFRLLEGERTEEQTPPAPYNLDHVIEGRCTCATRCHYDQDGREFVDFISSYPLTNNNDEVTHILHVSQELPPLPESVESSMEP